MPAPLESEFLFRNDLEGIEPVHLEGFFEGWPDPPSPERHLAILEGSSMVELAVDIRTGRVAGFANLISDGILSAFIPLLEVRRAHRGRGIGTGLVRRLLERTSDLYMLDVACDPEVTSFYGRLGFREGNAMLHRRYERQSAESPPTAP